MSHLKVTYFSGEEFEHPLQQSEAVSIGKNDSNDITIDGPDVGLMHCRIIWKEDTYELTAANLDGVHLNGDLVRQANLKSGDELRIGDADITVYIEEKSSLAKQVDSSVNNPEEVLLKPLTDDELPIPPVSTSPPPQKLTEEKPEKRTEKKMAKNKPSRDDKKSASSSKRKPSRKKKKEDSAFPDDFFEEEDVVEEKKIKARPTLKRMGGASTVEEEPSDESEGASTEGEEEKEKSQSSGISMLKKKLTPKPVRPGERDAVRSPIVLTLGGGALILVVASLAIWFLIGRTSAENYYNAAMKEKEDRKYSQAITMLEKFTLKYPGSELKKDALYALLQSRVEQPLFSSSSTKWADAVKAVDQFIDLDRDNPDHKDHYKDIYRYAHDIALGATNSSLKGKGLKPPARRKLLELSEKAKGWARRYGDKEDGNKEEAEKVEEFINQIEATTKEAIREITKQETFLTAEENINKALENKDPMKAFSLRIKLLERHPDFSNDRKLSALVNKTLKTEQELIKKEKFAPSKAALTKEPSSIVPRPLSLTLNTGLSAGNKSSGSATVIAIAENCCYGIDAENGHPLWRRKIGLDTPFFPVLVQTDVEAVLLFDMNRTELMLLERHTGKLIWRQPIQGAASGEPLIHDGQIYLPTMSNQLWKISLENGAVSTRLTFSQPIVSRPLLISEGKQLVVAGEKAVLYLLSTSPLECQSVSYLGHNSGAVIAPLIAMGSLILMPENFGLDECRLQVLKVSRKTKRLQKVDTKKIDGLVRDRAVLRGNKLFIPFSNERVIAFTASDDPEQPPLTKIAEYKISEPQDVTSYLSTGPDKQLWVGSSALYRLQLKPKEIEQLGDRMAVGTMTQPMQLIGQDYFLGRESQYGTAVFFTRTEREGNGSSWRVILGARILAMTTRKNNKGTSLVCLTETGDAFRIGEKDIDQGGFKLTLSLSSSSSSPSSQKFHHPKEKWKESINAISVSNNQLFAYHGGKKRAAWWIRNNGQRRLKSPLPKDVEGTPIPLGDGVILPQKGRLQLFFGKGGRRVVPFVAVIEKGKDIRWKFLAPIDKTQFLACDNQNHLYRIQYNKRQRLLAKGSLLDLAQPIDVAPVYHQGRIAIADATGMLKILDVQSLETISEKRLPAPATNTLWVVGNQLLVETSNNQLTAFQMGKELKQLWSIQFTQSKNGLAGVPLFVEEKILLITRSGEAITLDPQKGTIIKRLNTGEPFTSGAIQVGKYLVVATLDGSLLRVESIMQSTKKETSTQTSIKNKKEVNR